MLPSGYRCTAIVFSVWLTSILVSAPSTAEGKPECGKIGGEWKMTYSGRSCEGESESGTFTLVVKNDCTFTLKKDNIFPFISSDIFSGKSIDIDGSNISVTADIDLDDCREVRLSGEMEAVDGRERIVGEYRYESQGGGDVQGVRTAPEN